MNIFLHVLYLTANIFQNRLTELNTTIDPSLPFGYGGQQCKVLVKLANYGISKQVVPWGIRGMLGTPFYLPPGVVLHRGKQAYTNKVCVFLLTLTVE